MVLGVGSQVVGSGVRGANGDLPGVLIAIHGGVHDAAIAEDEALLLGRSLGADGLVRPLEAQHQLHNRALKLEYLCAGGRVHKGRLDGEGLGGDLGLEAGVWGLETGGFLVLDFGVRVLGFEARDFKWTCSPFM